MAHSHVSALRIGFVVGVAIMRSCFMCKLKCTGYHGAVYT